MHVHIWFLALSSLYPKMRELDSIWCANIYLSCLYSYPFPPNAPFSNGNLYSSSMGNISTHWNLGGVIKTFHCTSKVDTLEVKLLVASQDNNIAFCILQEMTFAKGLCYCTRCNGIWTWSQVMPIFILLNWDII